jgi:hypothetical protein
MRLPSGAQRVAKLMDAGPDLLIAIIIAFIRWVMGVVVRTYEAYDTASYMYTTLVLKSDALRPSRLSLASPLIRALPAPLIASGRSAVAASVAASAKPEKRISPSSTIIHLDEEGHDVDDEPSPDVLLGRESSSSSSCRFLDCAEATSPRAEAVRPTAKLPERREVEETCDPEALALHANAEVQPAAEMQPAVST